MEIIPYILDVILFAFALYWSAANAATKPGTPVFGLFRYRTVAGRSQGGGANPNEARRRFRPLTPASGPVPTRPDASGAGRDPARPNAARPNPRGLGPTRQLPRR